jgi:Protein of unknown function (DUF2838)
MIDREIAFRLSCRDSDHVTKIFLAFLFGVASQVSRSKHETPSFRSLTCCLHPPLILVASPHLRESAQNVFKDTTPSITKSPVPLLSSTDSLYVDYFAFIALLVNKPAYSSALQLPSSSEQGHIMSEPVEIPSSKSEASVPEDAAIDMARTGTQSSNEDAHLPEPLTPNSHSSTPSTPKLHSRNSSFISNSYQEDWDTFPPLDKLTFFDIFDNLALPSKLEKWQTTLAAQRDRVKKQQERIRSTGANAKDRAVAEWRKRVPTADEQLLKYRKRMKHSVDHLQKRWNDAATISAREKVSFISAVLNVFISGYIIGACPEYFYWWFTAQLCYFMPIRFVSYRQRGYHYFLADLCYFVNFLLMLSIWIFPRSKRLFISTYCLAYGNNAVAIAMWRNSLVFHSLDKVTSLFIHVMPPVTLHCLVHLTPTKFLQESFPAIYTIKFSLPGSPEHYSLSAMLIWATVPYAVWQLSYHFFITVRRREKIAAGRPTSFTWLRRSYAKTWIGKLVLSLPEFLQEPSFMLIQYCYALLTILPCPIWFWYRWASAAFLLSAFGWSVWNGANYYMDIFGKRFQNELEQMKKDVAKWQSSPDGHMWSPTIPAKDSENDKAGARRSIDQIPPLDEKVMAALAATGVDVGENENVTERKQQ